MALLIQAFPVRYPDSWTSGRSLPSNSRGSVEICFTDSFDHVRDDDPNDNEPGKPHRAIDIFGEEGLIVASATNGTVANFYFAGRRFRGVDNNDGGGNFVVIIDDYGYMHYYAHLQRHANNIAPGNRVFAGQEIGRLGHTGKAGPWHLRHLHYQVCEPRPDTSPDGTNGFSAREAGKTPVNPFSQLRDLAKRGFWRLDRFGRISIPPKLIRL